MQSTSAPYSSQLLQRASHLVKEHGLDKEEPTLPSLQADLSQIDSKLDLLRQQRFSNVDRTQFSELSGVLQRLEVCCLNLSLSTAEGARSLQECYEEIIERYRGDLSLIRQEITIRKATGSLSQPVMTSLTTISDKPLDQDKERAPYSTAVSSLKALLRTLSNPLVFRDLQNIFKLMRSSSIGGNGFRDSYSSTVLPKNISQILDEWDQEYRKLCRTPSPTSRSATMDMIKEDINKLIATDPPKLQPWAELEDLFSLEPVRKLDDEIVKEILDLVHQGRLSQLRSFIPEKLRQNGTDLDTLNKEIEKRGKFDLNSVIGQAVAKRPIDTNGIVSNWDKPHIFFEDKMLLFGGASSVGNPSGIITDATPFGKGWSFKLDNDFHIKIFPIQQSKPCYTIKIGKILRSRLLSEIIWENEEPFELVRAPLSPDHPLPPSCVENGKYHLSFNLSFYQRHVLKAVAMLVCEDSNKNYCITYTSSGKRSFDYSFYRIKKKTGVAVFLEKWSKEEFNSIYLAQRSRDTAITKNSEELERLVTFSEQKSEFKLKIAQDNAIKQSLKRARSALMKPSNQSLLHALAETLIRSNLENIDADFESFPSELAGSLQDASRWNKEYFNLAVSPHVLLRKVVLEAIYSRFEVKTSALSVVHTMELLKEGRQHADQLKNKSGILVMGNTGSGKSTLISYLLGAVLEGGENKFKENTVYLSSKNDGDKIYPSIGQGLGTSQTLHAQGWRIPTIPDGPRIIDCAGFSETRGTRWEICASLSLDEVVESLHELRSLVIVTPFSAFQDKANGFLDLMTSIQDRFPADPEADFPGLFVPGSAVLGSLYLVITKTSLEIFETLGPRILEHIREIEEQQNQQLSTDEGSKNKGPRQSLENKKRIWQSLQELHVMNHILFGDVLDQNPRQRMLSHLIAPAYSNLKEAYAPAMETISMRRDLGNIVEEWTDTWKNILEKYLDTKGVIETNESDIASSRNYLSQLQLEKVNKTSQILQYQSQIEAVCTQLEGLEKAKNSSSEIPNNIYELMQVQQKESLQRQLDLYEAELAQLTQSVVARTAQLGKTRTEIGNADQEIARTEFRIQHLRTEIPEKSVGDQEVLITDYSFKPDDKVELFQSSKKADELVLKEIRNYLPTEKTHSEVVSAKELDGTYRTLFIIEKEFRLVPADPKLMEQFAKVFKASGAEGTYEATVEGGPYSSVKFNAAVSGKKIAYMFSIVWTRNGSLPWIKITYRVPKKEFYAATLINLTSELERLLDKQLLLERTKATLKVEEVTLEHSINQISQECRRLGDAIVAQQERIHKELGRISNRMEELIHESKEALERLTHRKGELEGSCAIEDNILATTQKIEELQKERKELYLTKRHLALTIKTQWETVSLLGQFARRVLLPTRYRQMQAERGEGIFKSCQEFLSIFDEKRDVIFNQCIQDLLTTSKE